MKKLNNTLLTTYQLYIDTLLHWQKSMNLISNNTIDDIWNRHIYDSLQLAKYITTQEGNIYDLGSGAGFPALVLAIYDTKNIYHLIESDTKKSVFLANLKRELNLDNVIIHNNRIEDIKNHHGEASIVTARALAPLKNLINYALPLLKNSGYCLFLKGKTYYQEILEAQQQYPNLQFSLFDSITNNESKIVKVTIK